jgi:hypothetical protein
LAVESDEPIACHELAQIFYNGVGVEKSEERAIELQEIALKRNPGTPPLAVVTIEEEKVEEREGESGGVGIVGIAIGAAIGAVFIGAGVKLYQYLRRES